MLRNFLFLTFRNLWRRKSFSFLNIMGLAIGMAACILIYLYVSNELSYDAFNEKAERIYRVVTYVQTPSEDHYFGTAPATGPTLQREFPQIERMARVMEESMLIQRPEQTAKQDGFIIADSSFFQIFTLPLIKGNTEEVLVEPFSVVLSESASQKYFGRSDPIGQTLIFDRQFNCKVTGVMKDMPIRSHFHSDIIVSMTSLTKLSPGMDSTQWNNFRGYTYLLLRDKYDSKQLQSRLPVFIDHYAGLAMKEGQVKFTLKLEHLKDIYLHSKYGSQESGNAVNVYIFSWSAILILLIACINFINLSSSIALERAKETGIRKLLGSSRKSLNIQFLTESVIYCLIALVIACIASNLLLPFFSKMSGKPIENSIFCNPINILLLLGITFIVGILSGIYPALILSAYKPISVLKGKFSTSKKGVRTRQTLVVFQFAMSVVLIVGTIISALQLKYMRQLPLGFRKEQMLVLSMPGNPETDKHYEMYKHELMKIAGVLSVSASNGIPGNQYGNMLTEFENADGQMQKAGIDMLVVDNDFIRQYQIPVLAGTVSLYPTNNEDMNKVIINEALLRKLGYANPQDAIGKRYALQGRISAVIKDFHYRSLREQINPLMIFESNKFFRYLTLNIKNEHLLTTMSAIESRWKTLVPESPFDATFLDDSINNLYKGENNFGRLFLYFSIFAIFISCLGLFGLAMFGTLQRTKEIGIRKVLGAGLLNLVTLLTKDFLIPVGISLLIAIPIGWYIMSRWLYNFAYRIQIELWIFVLAGLAAMLIAIITVSYQSLKVAIANPVKSLRTE